MQRGGSEVRSKSFSFGFWAGFFVTVPAHGLGERLYVKGACLTRFKIILERTWAHLDTATSDFARWVERRSPTRHFCRGFCGTRRAGGQRSGGSVNPNVA